MAASFERSGTRGKSKVIFLALTRRWWRGAVLLSVLTVGAVLSWWHDVRQADVVQVDRGATAISTGSLIPLSGAAPTTAPEDEPAAVAAVAAVSTTAAPSVNSTAVRAHPFDELRLERERQRAREAEMLQTTAQDASISEMRRRDAHEQLLALWKREAREVEIEHLLLAQGYTGMVILSESAAHVVVDGLLDAAAAGRIGELVHRVSGVRRESITIVDGITSGR